MLITLLVRRRSSSTPPSRRSTRFRVVLNTVFGTDLPLLDDRTYFTSHRLERQAIDITAERDSRANCRK